MLQDNLEVFTNDAGEVTGVKQEIKMNTMGVRAFARMVKQVNKSGLKKDFAKECRVVGVIPFFMPDGTFTEDKHAMNLDPEQLDYLLKHSPDFDVDPKASR
ncbi:MAG: hypothetical protein DRP85_06465 [Candidatus Makaraimicrobium thalassicum]|nr:MAG: hypothetical protein DRP85_06465 [Candidatus Omnitrophota bacterium]